MRASRVLAPGLPQRLEDAEGRGSAGSAAACKAFLFVQNERTLPFSIYVSLLSYLFTCSLGTQAADLDLRLSLS